MVLLNLHLSIPNTVNLPSGASRYFLIKVYVPIFDYNKWIIFGKINYIRIYPTGTYFFKKKYNGYETRKIQSVLRSCKRLLNQ